MTFMSEHGRIPMGILLGLLLLGSLAFSMLFQVEETEFAIVKLFGDPWRVETEPGLQ